MIARIMKPSVCPPQPSASTDNTNLGLDNSHDHAQPHPIIVQYCKKWMSELDPEFGVKIMDFKVAEMNATLN